ncbi:MAG: Mannose-phosphate guanylyltransferase [Bacteroidota bacterium]|nr:Mannose-phosphate guanylyltransferase [Bacteroidota bacterium]
MPKNQKPKKIAVVMAGGLGLRLWPRSTEKNPKQFIHLIGDGTMIQNTVDRLKKIFAIEDIYVVVLESMYELVEYQLPDLPKENIILEPFGRNTAPCIALTAITLRDKYPLDTIIAAFPADHVIYNLGEFYESVQIACEAAEVPNRIITIGVKPTRPEIGYGYVQYLYERTELGELYEKGLRYSSTFAEKPDYATAQRFVESGDFLWNTGIFIWRFDTFWNAMDKYMLEDSSLFKTLINHIGKDSMRKNVEYIYKQVPSISIDYAILEKSDNVFVVESTFRWSDIGTWDELYRISMKDARNNVIEGDVISINTTNCFISSNARVIGIAGIKDLIVVDSDYALLICRRGHSEDIKDIIDSLRRKNINRLL